MADPIEQGNGHPPVIGACKQEAPQNNDKAPVMSKKKKRKTRAQKRKERANTLGHRQDSRDIVMDNDHLVKFYKAQPFILDDEFDLFLQWLRTTLPASFRINAFEFDQAKFLRRLIRGPELCEFLIPSSTTSNPEDKTVLPEGVDASELQCAAESEDKGDDEKIKNQSNNDNPDAIDSDSVEPSDGEKIAKSTTAIHKAPTLEPLTWYPQELAWQMNITRVDLKKSPVLQGLHKFIMAETDNGFISRQESVSMIPPLLLDICRGQNVLDMCAAPGSKTAQLLEYLNFDLFNTGKHAEYRTNDLFDDGLVVANDVDNKRCYMLVHQANRLNSPNCVIINEDASRLPDMKILDDNGQEKLLKFDRILCDVPCSGDGTVRKNPDVWRKWTVANANNFHGMQIKILKRGLELLNENGLLVYSTCSMNPAEDESVIASILRSSQGRVVLEDVSNKLRGLKYKPGASNWVVMGRDMEPIPSRDHVKPDQSSQIYPDLFPPTEEEANQFHLDRCIRMLPHLQNTGAFFVALLRKVAPTLPWEDERRATELAKAPKDDSESKSVQPKLKRRRYAGFKEDPFLLMDSDDQDWSAIKKAFGIDDKFPYDQLVHRCKGAGKKRSISLVSKRTRDFMVANQERPDKSDFVKLINGGMRLFARAGSEVGFRICQDGVREILPFVKEELKVAITREDLISLLRARSVSFDQLSSGGHIRDVLEPGSLILIYRHETAGEESFEKPLVAWKGERSVALYVSKTYRVHLCALVQLKLSEAVLG